MLALEIKDLKKVYGKSFAKQGFCALRGVSFSVAEGSIFGLIGPNGAGKTTAIKSIINLVKPTSGSISIFGKDSRAGGVRSEIGYMPETEKYPEYLTGRQLVDVLYRLTGREMGNYKKRLNEWIDLTGLSSVIDKNIREYSRGMRKKIGLIQSVLHEPRLLLLDEPIEGMDVMGKKAIFDKLIEYRNEGKTILINSHYLSEIEKICDRVAIIKQGEILTELDPKNNTKTATGFFIGVYAKGPNSIGPLTDSFPIKIEKPDTLFLESDDEVLLNKLILHLCNNGVLINRIEKAKRTLEEVFVSTIQDN